MNYWQCFIKRSFDIFLSVTGLIAFSWLILICWIISGIDTGQNGFYTQERVGKMGKIFRIIKIRTMKPVKGYNSVVTTRNDPRITRSGSLLRRLKLDELPQLINILLGQMSFVGPRPDVVGFADLLHGDDYIILSVRPGITGPATLAYRHEEELLAHCDDPEGYNRDVIFPAKIRINRHYIEDYSFYKDMLYILSTAIPQLQNWVLPELKSMCDV